ncbi:unnamed protein product [Rhizophagus irregularis]|nr:unnamed protein product [Rhizophagus irregularis]
MTNLSGTKDANIYNEVARLNLAQRPKTCLFSYFTINEKSKSSAETALSFCEDDEEKLAYLNNILSCMFLNSNHVFVLLYILMMMTSKGKYVHIEHGKLVGYGSELSVEEYIELMIKNPGMLYSLIEQEVVRIRI